MQVIYEPKGRAGEYAKLALNLFSGCPNSCLYCYAPLILHKDRMEFHQHATPRVTLEDIKASAKKWQGDKRPVLLCFTSDPYPPPSLFPMNADRLLTRGAIEILHAHGLHITILTKGGLNSVRDFDVLGPGDAYATSLTLLEEGESAKWEPRAAPPLERIHALQAADRRGIPTWVSLEPVIRPEVTLALIRLTSAYTDHYKLGKLNYHPLARTIDWPDYLRNALKLLESLHKLAYIKKDLAHIAGRDAGYWVNRE